VLHRQVCFFSVDPCRDHRIENWSNSIQEIRRFGETRFAAAELSERLFSEAKFESLAGRAALASNERDDVAHAR
jgi:hypothetical protein